jgi:hypothetical protein
MVGTLQRSIPTDQPSCVIAWPACPFSDRVAPISGHYEDDPPTFASWLKHERTRTSGYAVDTGNYMRGIVVVAVPAFNAGGRMLGCVCAIGLREQISGARLAALIESVRAAAGIISREMGHGASLDQGSDSDPASESPEFRRPQPPRR